MNDLLRVAVIGVGFGDAVLVPAFVSDPRVVVVGVCATTSERAQRAAERRGLPRFWDDWRRVVDDREVDAIAIAVPPSLQSEIVRAAIGARKHVFCEKPVGIHPSETRPLLALAQEAGVAHAVDFEFGELPSWQRARTLLAESTWRHFALSWRVETRAVKLGAHAWKGDASRGGGALLGFGSHAIFAIEHLLGRIREVAAHFQPSGGEAERRVDAWLHLESGVTGVLSVATDAFHGTGFGLEVYGDDGALRLENRTGDHLRNYVLSTRRRGEASSSVHCDERELAGSEVDGRIAPVASLVKRFVDAALGGPPVQPSLEMGIRVDEVLFALRRAAQTTRWEKP